MENNTGESYIDRMIDHILYETTLCINTLELEAKEGNKKAIQAITEFSMVFSELRDDIDNAKEKL